MAASKLLERTSFGVPMSSYVPSVPTPSPVPTTGNFVAVPRCNFTFEKCKGGFKLSCSCSDPVSCGVVQNLCSMLAGGLVSCCVTLNGTTVCYCNFNCGICKCVNTEDGVCVTCTSGDTKCCEMLQACCECVRTLTEAGCNCCLLINNTPVCCC